MLKQLDYFPKIGLALVLSAVLALIATPFVMKLTKKVGAMDVPKDERRMHHVPIPRMGGLAIIFGFTVSVLLFVNLDTQTCGILAGAAVIAALGIADDILALRAMPKFIVQLLAAAIVVLHGCRIEVFLGLHLPVWLSWIVSILWIVTITNAVNFIDGLDGLAAGVSAISAGTMLIVALLLLNSANPLNVVIASAIMLASIVGACIGFIPYNFNPARIFMGDTGSTFLGFMLSSISIYGLFKTYAVISFLVPFLVLGLPICDISFAVIRRLLHGQSPMHADRGHIHHRLIDMGFSQKQVVAICYLISAVLGLAAVVLTDRNEIQMLILLAAVVLIGSISVRLVFQHWHPKKPEGDKTDEQN